MQIQSQPFLKVKDYSVSQESFDLILDEKYDMLITHPKPQDSDLGKYYNSEDYISHTDSKRSFFEKVYHQVRVYTIAQKERLLFKEVKRAGKVLDIGCGTGDFLAYCKVKKWDTFGIEPSEKAKAIAQKKGVAFFNSLDEIPDNTFDAITLWHVLEHVPDLDFYINQISRIAKPGATIIVAVPNFKSYDANFYKQYWAAYDVPRHLWHFSKTSIKNLFEDKNFSLVKTLPMYFDSFYVSMLSEKYKNGKMNFLKSFFVGFRSNMHGMIKNEYSSHIYVLLNTKKSF